MISRRELFATGAAFAIRAGAPSGSSSQARVSSSIRLGVASYSLRKLTRKDAIAAIKALGIRYVNIKSFHLPYEATRDELVAGRREFEQARLEIVGGGTISLTRDDDDDIRSYFEYAKTCRMPLMVIAPTPETLPRIETFVEEYDIAVAIHNHGPEDPNFPAPADALKLIRNMDSRIGVCIDVGHTARTGVDVVREIANARDRLLDIHMKDLRDLRVKDSQCIVGEGGMPVGRILRQLEAMRYRGFVNLEYEIDADAPLPGMKQSIAYMRGVLAGLASS